METIEIFQENLKELMQDKNLDIIGLSKAVGCDKTAIRRWFYGRYFPQPQTLIKLADYFECSADYLFGLTDSPEFVPQEIVNSFQERFTEMKKALGVTDYRIAKACHVRKSTVCKWKRVETPGTISLFNLAKYFNCSMEFLLGRSKE